MGRTSATPLQEKLEVPERDRQQGERTCDDGDGLDVGDDFAEVLGEASDGFAAVGFILNAIEAGKNAGARLGTGDASGKTGNGVQANRGRSLATMRNGYFHAIDETSERDFQARIRRRQVGKRFDAGINHGGLQAGS